MIGAVQLGGDALLVRLAFLVKDELVPIRIDAVGVLKDDNGYPSSCIVTVAKSSVYAQWSLWQNGATMFVTKSLQSSMYAST